MYNASQIAYENGEFWVLTLPDSGGYEVYRKGITHSTRCAHYGRIQNALQRAIADADRRAKELQ